MCWLECFVMFQLDSGSAVGWGPKEQKCWLRGMWGASPETCLYVHVFFHLVNHLLVCLCTFTSLLAHLLELHAYISHTFLSTYSLAHWLTWLLTWSLSCIRRRIHNVMENSMVCLSIFYISHIMCLMSLVCRGVAVQRKTQQKRRVNKHNDKRHT